MVFNFNAKHVFLTYPQTTLTKEALYEASIRWGCVSGTIGQEKHQDGGLHLHAVFAFDRKRHIRDERFFDLEGYHPNVQSARNVKAVREYCEKEDPEALRYGAFEGCEKIDWKDLLGLATDSAHFIKLVTDRDVSFCVKHFSNVRAFAEYTFRSRKEDFTPQFTDFRNQLRPMQDFHAELLRPSRPRERHTSIVIVGATRLGKTEWARSLGNHTYWSGAVDWTRHDNHSRYAVIDDLSLEYIPRLQQIFGCQHNISVSQKYKPIMTFDWGIPVIYLTNDENYLEKQPDFIKSWWQNNVVTCHVRNKLFV
ncbi:replication associated protein [Lake Sarah-associated circular virus-26]|uniref:replication associated protein n=1 Tax=Lake Sarah-associated circular virus-26 TaxID=1685753 RepID=UPI000776D93F|nr:replication associated protein [Lake Sarah-associated circular virus-26]ALE29682.1 replication associated protein [Lake Sarah-associated circular virus-26]